MIDPVTGIALAKYLAEAVKAVANYKKTRDRMVEAGTVTYADDEVISNNDLIKLFRQDSEKMEAHADDLIAKWEAKSK